MEAPPVHPFRGLDVAELIRIRARTRPDHPFLIWEPFEGPGATLTYAAFADKVGRVAAGLAQRGVTSGEYVLIHLDNCLETLVAWYACATLGAVAVTTNARSSLDELSYFASHCGAVAAITQPRFAELVNAASKDFRFIAVTSHDNGAPPAPGFAPGSDSFEALIADAPLAPRAPDAMHPLGVQYTSGTTSRPKGVLWTHANALWGARVNAAHEDLRKEDVHLVHLPLFHTNAQAYSVLATLWAGGTAVIMPKFSASRFWPLSLKHRCTWTSMIPFCLRALMGVERPPAHFYRLWGSGVCEPPTDRHFGVKTIGWWGMTETISHGIVGDAHLPNVPMSCGRAAPEYGIHIEDDEGRPVGSGETGHLKVRGVRGLSLFREYINNATATAESFDARGLFLTGDRVTLLADGSIQFSDRDKDMLKVGGENVAASEIERVIMSVPGVREAAVVSKPHPMLDEAPVAFVIAEQGRAEALPAEIVAACKAALADFKAPHEIRIVPELPRSTLEKVAKAELRKLLRD
jgi:crotonobetaine/carnitine-CoA ligase